MHMRGEPATMQQAVHYEDVVGEVRAIWPSALQACEAAGIAAERLCVDPGFGFGKHTGAQSASCCGDLRNCAALERPVLVGLSRKVDAQAN